MFLLARPFLTLYKGYKNASFVKRASDFSGCMDFAHWWSWCTINEATLSSLKRSRILSTKLFYFSEKCQTKIELRFRNKLHVDFPPAQKFS